MKSFGGPLKRNDGPVIARTKLCLTFSFTYFLLTQLIRYSAGEKGLGDSASTEDRTLVLLIPRQQLIDSFDGMTEHVGRNVAQRLRQLTLCCQSKVFPQQVGDTIYTERRPSMAVECDFVTAIWLDDATQC